MEKYEDISNNFKIKFEDLEEGQIIYHLTRGKVVIKNLSSKDSLYPIELEGGGAFTTSGKERDYDVNPTLFTSNPFFEKVRIQKDGTLYIGEGLENYYKSQLEKTKKYKVQELNSSELIVGELYNLKYTGQFCSILTVNGAEGMLSDKVIKDCQYVGTIELEKCGLRQVFYKVDLGYVMFSTGNNKHIVKEPTHEELMALWNKTHNL